MNNDSTRRGRRISIEWYRDRAIAVTGLIYVILAISLTIVVFLNYGKLQRILNGVRNLEVKARELSEQRIAGLNLKTLRVAIDMLAGTGIYSYHAGKSKRKSAKEGAKA